MSVIITGRDMPDSCESCRLQFSNCDIRYNLGVIESGRLKLDKKRHPNCPLKSVEGLIDEIEQLYLDDGAIQEYSKDEIVDLIERYCEVSEDV